MACARVYAPCYNIVTDFTITQVRCDHEVCVNLYSKHKRFCILYLIEELHNLQHLGPRYVTGAPQPLKLADKLIENTMKDLRELGEAFPREEMIEALKVSEADLKELMEEAKPQLVASSFSPSHYLDGHASLTI